MVDVVDLWKRYPGAWALRGASFTVARGRVSGVLGENGSGKSTLFRILAGVTRSTRGRALIGGAPAGVVTKPVVSYLPETDPFYSRMNVREQLDFLSRFRPRWDWRKARHLLEFMNLPDDRKIGALSRGQRARLKVVTAFSWTPEVVLMDEPLGGSIRRRAPAFWTVFSTSSGVRARRFLFRPTWFRKSSPISTTWSFCATARFQRRAPRAGCNRTTKGLSAKSSRCLWIE